jgi:hypothetical protein
MRTELTDVDIQRLRNYPIDKNTGSYISFDDYLKINNGFDAEFAAQETIKVLEKNQQHGEEYYPDAEVTFLTSPKLVYKHYTYRDGIRGVLQIKYKGPNKEGLEPGRSYERDMEYLCRYSALDCKNVGWSIILDLPLSDYSPAE